MRLGKEEIEEVKEAHSLMSSHIYKGKNWGKNVCPGITKTATEQPSYVEGQPDSAFRKAPDYLSWCEPVSLAS